MTVITILIKSGTFNDFTTLALITSGAIAVDFEVRIFAMNDAVWALRKDVIGQDTMIHSHFPEFAEKLAEASNLGKLVPWWSLFEDLKDFGDLTINVCALVADVTGLEKEDFADIVDGIAGVAQFAADVDDSDFVLSI